MTEMDAKRLKRALDAKDTVCAAVVSLDATGRATIATQATAQELIILTAYLQNFANESLFGNKRIIVPEAPRL